MKSGLEDRNNVLEGCEGVSGYLVSMKSGLEDRNNKEGEIYAPNFKHGGLNEVRPGRPEQFRPNGKVQRQVSSLNEVRPGRPEQ